MACPSCALIARGVGISSNVLVNQDIIEDNGYKLHIVRYISIALQVSKVELTIKCGTPVSCTHSRVGR